MTRFAALEVAGWRQFGAVQIEFHLVLRLLPVRMALAKQHSSAF